MCSHVTWVRLGVSVLVANRSKIGKKNQQESQLATETKQAPSRNVATEQQLVIEADMRGEDMAGIKRESVDPSGHMESGWYRCVELASHALKSLTRPW